MKKNRKQRKMLRDFYSYACSTTQLRQIKGGDACCGSDDDGGHPPPPPLPKTTTAAGSQAMPESWGS